MFAGFKAGKLLCMGSGSQTICMSLNLTTSEGLATRDMKSRCDFSAFHFFASPFRFLASLFRVMISFFGLPAV